MTDFIGWRCWKVRDWQTGLLGAAFMDYAWDGPSIRVPEGDMAQLPLGAGYHAFKNEQAARDYLEMYATIHAPIISTVLVVGKVQLYGTVVEHEHGYRASHAIVRHLWVSPVWGEEMRTRLADRYQCPVETWEPAEPQPKPDRLQQEYARLQGMAGLANSGFPAGAAAGLFNAASGLYGMPPGTVVPRPEKPSRLNWIWDFLASPVPAPLVSVVLGYTILIVAFKLFWG